jgi:hypothetical protein
VADQLGLLRARNSGLLTRVTTSAPNECPLRRHWPDAASALHIVSAMTQILGSSQLRPVCRPFES